MSHMQDVDTMLSTHAAHVSELHVSMNATIKAAVRNAKLDLKDSVKELEKALLDYIEMEYGLTERMEVLNKVKSGSLRATEGTSLVNGVETSCNQLKKRRQPDAYKEHEKYQLFQRGVWKALHPDEDYPEDEDQELTVVSSNIEVICPLTRMLFEIPVTNRNCKHTYEKEAILDVIKQHKKNRHKLVCPVAGCSKEVDEKSLYENKEVANKVAKHKQNMASQAAQEDDETVVEL